MSKKDICPIFFNQVYLKFVQYSKQIARYNHLQMDIQEKAHANILI